MGSTDVLVLGGGFAGLAAATALAEGGARVTLLEKRPHLGGRAYSFRDPRTGETVDNGQHLFLGCYRETRAFLARIGASGLLRFPAGVRVDYLEADGGRDRLACPGWLPAPMHLAWGVARMRGLSWTDKAALLGLRDYFLRHGSNGDLPADLDRLSVRQWLDGLEQPPRLQRLLFNPIALGALNELPERASALGFAQVLREVFFRDAQGSRLGLAGTGLSELYTGAAARFVAERGGSALVSRAVELVAREGGRWTVRTRDGGAFSAGAVISALPPWSLGTLSRPASLRGPWESLAATPILGIHLWLDRPVVDRPVIGLIGTEIHWIFDKTALWGRREAGQYLSLVISGAHAHVGRPPAELLALARAELGRCLPAFGKARIAAWSVIKEPRATPSPVPGTDAARPEHRSPEPGFFYAGDWTQTGLPATIESAVKSGHATARLALAS